MLLESVEELEAVAPPSPKSESMEENDPARPKLVAGERSLTSWWYGESSHLNFLTLESIFSEILRAYSHLRYPCCDERMNHLIIKKHRVPWCRRKTKEESERCRFHIQSWEASSLQNSPFEETHHFWTQKKKKKRITFSLTNTGRRHETRENTKVVYFWTLGGKSLDSPVFTLPVFLVDWNHLDYSSFNFILARTVVLISFWFKNNFVLWKYIYFLFLSL